MNRSNIAAGTQSFVCQFQSQKKVSQVQCYHLLQNKFPQNNITPNYAKIETSSSFPAFQSAQKKAQNLRMQGETELLHMKLQTANL
jgi:hypothetical protein